MGEPHRRQVPAVIGKAIAGEHLTEDDSASEQAAGRPATIDTQQKGHMATGSKTVTCKFEQENETKNKIRFSELSDEPVIGKLYISKTVFAEMGEPQTLTVTIKP